MSDSITVLFGLSRCAGALLALAIGLASAGSASAATDGQAFQDWTVRCGQSENDPAVEDCFIVQLVIDKERNKPVMQVAVGYLVDQPQPAAVVTVPLGVRLPPGAGLRIDDGEVIKIPFEWCVPDGCKVQFRLDEDTMAKFRKGLTGTVIFQDSNGRNIGLPFSLKGFTAAINSLRQP